MSTVKTGWLSDNSGEKFAPKTLTSQIQTNDGQSLDAKIQQDINNAVEPETLDLVTISNNTTLQLEQDYTYSVSDKSIFERAAKRGCLVIKLKCVMQGLDETKTGTFFISTSPVYDGTTYTCSAVYDYTVVTVKLTGTTLTVSTRSLVASCW